MNWHIPLETCDFLARELKFGVVFLVQNLNKLLPVSDQDVSAKTYFEYICYIIILLTIITAAPI